MTETEVPDGVRLNPETGARMQDWSTIVVGDMVELGGKVWQCVDRIGSVVEVEREDGKKHKGEPKGPVKVISTAAQDMELAVATAQIRLGGQVIATRDGSGRFLVPATYPDVGSLLTHLYTLHGVTVQADSIRDGLRKHEWLHRPENKVAGQYEEHYHDPDFYREREWERPGRLAAPK